MGQKVKEENRENVAKDRCSHYWIIEVANGPRSRGVCRYCGETRDFLNSMPDLNVPKRKNNPLDLPKMPEVELDDESKS
jgi:hypothetical protein